MSATRDCDTEVEYSQRTMQKTQSYFDPTNNPHYQGYYPTNGYGYDPQSLGYGYSGSSSEPQVAYRSSCLMQGQGPPPAHQPGAMDYSPQGYGAPYTQGMPTGSPTFSLPSQGPMGMGLGGPGKPHPPEIYPWMKESRQNSKQRTGGSMSPDITGELMLHVPNDK